MPIHAMTILKEMSPERTVFDSEIGRTWFLCSYCYRAFLHVNLLLQHKIENHEEEFYEEKDIKRSGSRKLEGRRTLAEEETQKVIVSDNEFDEYCRGKDGSGVTEEIRRDDRKGRRSLRTRSRHNNDLCESATNLMTQYLKDFNVNVKQTNIFDSAPTDKDRSRESSKSKDDISGDCSEHAKNRNEVIKKSFRAAFQETDSEYQKCGFCSSKFPTKCSLKLHELVFHNQRKMTEIPHNEYPKITPGDAVQ